MSAQSTSFLTRVRLREPLYLNSLALVANTAATSALGMLFWILAARRYSADIVGATSALISLLLLLANIAELNLSSALVRFLPTAGSAQRRLLLSSYGLAGGLGVVVAIAALPFVQHFALVVQLQRLGPLGIAWFCLAVATWCCFALQDAAAVALRGAVLVPAENALFGLAKIGALVGFAALAPTFGILAAWTLPMAFMLFPVNGLILGVLLPAEKRRDVRPERVSARDVRTFVLFDYLTCLATTAATAVVPLVVAVRLGNSAAGYFYVVWVIGAAFEVALSSVGSAYVAEASRAQDRVAPLAAALVRRVYLLTTPCVLVIAAGAPVVLRLYGPAYARHGAALLRLLALAVLPRALTLLWMSVHRVRRSIGRVLAVQVTISSAMLLATIGLLQGHRGIEVVGAAYLGCQTAVAVALLPSFLRMLRGAPPQGIAHLGRVRVLKIGSITPAARLRTVLHPARRRTISPEVPAIPLKPAYRRAAIDRIPIGMVLAATIGAVVLWCAALRQIKLDDVGNYGFITALRPLFFVAVTVLLVAFCAALFRAQPPSWVLGVQVVALVLMLHGTVLIVEPVARFSTAWVHAGFTDYIARTGKTMPGYDARFNWPGFFGFTAFLSRALGFSNPMPLLRFAPLAFELAYVLPVYAIASSTTRDQRMRWMAVWLFVSINWVGQDYFAPQALAYFFALVLVAVLLRYFKQVSPPQTEGLASARLNRRALHFLVGRREEVSYDLPRGVLRAQLLAILIVLFGAISVSHQITGPLVIVAIAALVVGRRCSVRTLPLLMLAIFGLWLSYGAVTFWSGHLADIFGQLGGLSTAVGENVSDRMQGSASRLGVQQVRIALTAGTFLLAGLGVLRRRRRGYIDLSMIAVAVTPFSVLLGQSYGGEALLRAVLFATPFLAVLAASAFIPQPAAIGRTSACAFIAIAMLLPAVFFVARYGNERWDMVTKDEHAALEFIYKTAPPGSTLISVVSEIPWGYRSIESFELEPRGERRILSEPDRAAEMLSRPAVKSYLVVTRQEAAFGELFGGLPPTWADRLVDSLLATGRFKLAFANRDAKVVTPITQTAPEGGS